VALETAHPEGQFEAVLEAASLAAWYGPPGLASQILARVSRQVLTPSWAHHWRILDLWIGEGEPRANLLAQLPEEPPPTMEVGAAFRWHLTMARAYLQTGERDRFAAAQSRAEQTAATQKSPVQERLAAVLRASGQGGQAMSKLLAAWPADDDALIGVFASEITAHMASLSEQALAILARATRTAPQRWLSPLRELLTETADSRGARAATIIEDVGGAEDIPRLREFTRRMRRTGPGWGDRLIERLAPRVIVDDLGPMSIRVGPRRVDGRSVRRKALALLAYLASQPRGAATPDQVIDALWPDLDPDQGANSLHQTIYFLRRVIDSAYRAGLSPEYVHYDQEVVSLDQVLVDCRSWEVRRLMSKRPETTEAVDSVVEAYQGQFATDFAYEDWAAGYRDRLHASFLAIVERAVTGSVGSSSLQWRLWVGQQCLAVDPEADAIEAHVIRLYGELGAPTAAAEQYAHYSAMLRDHLGVEPPPLEELLGGPS
jgi:DNA-binding SARP family transcriptional activator